MTPGPALWARLTTAETRLATQLTTPARVQAWLNELPYNTEPAGATQRSFRGVVSHGEAHCMEAALSAATLLELHGRAPLVMSLESVDLLDHVIFVYQTGTGWGSIARSRDPGLHGRRPVFRTLRDLALSYVEPYIDTTGRLKGYGLLDLRDVDPYDWRLSPRNVWHVEQRLIELPHRRIATSDARIARLRSRYLAFMATHPGFKPLYYRGQDRWMPLPRAFAPSVRLARQLAAAARLIPDRSRVSAAARVPDGPAPALPGSVGRDRCPDSSRPRNSGQRPLHDGRPHR